MAILKNVCGQHSMCEMEENFNREICIDTLRIMSGNVQLEEMPHYDTLNYYLERLSPKCLSGLRKKMITSLIRGKQFNKWRLQGKYWNVILDGTGLFYIKEKHCENCLCTVRTGEDGKKTKRYYHKVVEAKIVFSEKVVLSPGTGFIENEKEDVSKQDCGSNAAKRLLKKIKKDYPRLPVCAQGAALYAAEPFMKLCSKTCHWKYLFTQKDTRQKKLDEGFEWIKSGEDAVRQTGLCKEKGTDFFANHVEEVAEKKETMNVYEYEYEKKDKEGEKQTVCFQWVTNLELTKTIKNTSSGLLESFRRLTVTDEDVSYTLRYTTVYLE